MYVYIYNSVGFEMRSSSHNFGIRYSELLTIND